MQLNIFNKNGENFLPICFYGQNRNQDVLDYHKKVFDKFGFPVNYIEFPFHITGHGDAVQMCLTQTMRANIDYYLFIDMDAVPLRSDFLDVIYDKVKDKRSIFSVAWTSNHKSPSHIHASACFLCFSREAYVKYGAPQMHDRIPRSDNVEELSWKAAEYGGCISLVYPTDYYPLTDEESKNTGNPKHWNLGGKFKYGLGTTYSDLFFHAGMQNIPRSAELFIKKCKEILGETVPSKKEAIVVCKGFSDVLKFTLPINKRYFDNFVVVTSADDLETQRVCRDNGVEFLEYSDFNKNGAVFNKGGAASYGILNLKHKDWVCFLDADTILTDDFLKLDIQTLDKEKFYGSYRRFIPTVKDLETVTQNPERKSDYESIEGSGCGFFQFVNLKSGTAKFFGLNNLYNDSHSSDQVDIDFLKKWCPLVENDPKLVKTNIETFHLGEHGRRENGSKFQ